VVAPKEEEKKREEERREEEKRRREEKKRRGEEEEKDKSREPKREKSFNKHHLSASKLGKREKHFAYSSMIMIMINLKNEVDILIS